MQSELLMEFMKTKNDINQKQSSMVFFIFFYFEFVVKLLNSSIKNRINYNAKMIRKIDFNQIRVCFFHS